MSSRRSILSSRLRLAYYYSTILYALVAHASVQMRTCLDLYHDEALLRSILETSRPHLVVEKFDLSGKNVLEDRFASCALRMRSTLYHSLKQSFCQGPLCSI